MTLIGVRAANHPQQVKKHGPDHDKDDRRTLPEVFDPIHAEFGFTIDVAASKENTKLPRFYTKEQNGLAQSWAGERVWCNPPYSDLRPWVEKALRETDPNSGSCPLVVMLLPNNRSEQGFWQDLIEPRRDKMGGGVETRFLPGRPRFGWDPSRALPEKGDRPPFGLVLVIFRGKGNEP